MKKSEISKNENPHVPSIEEVSSDIEVILDILESYIRGQKHLYLVSKQNSDIYLNMYFILH